VVLERELKCLDIVSVLGELGCMCVDNFGEQVAVVALVVVDRSVRADGHLAGDVLEPELLVVLLAHAPLREKRLPALRELSNHLEHVALGALAFLMVRAAPVAQEQAAVRAGVRDLVTAVAILALERRLSRRTSLACATSLWVTAFLVSVFCRCRIAERTVSFRSLPELLALRTSDSDSWPPTILVMVF